MERTIDDCFKLKLRNCCIDCLNFEPKVTRFLKDGKVENWIGCANSKGCYCITEELELEQIERENREGGDIYGN